MGENDIMAGDKFRCSILDRADAENPYPLWHGWAIMEAFLRSSRCRLSVASCFHARSLVSIPAPRSARSGGESEASREWRGILCGLQKRVHRVRHESLSGRSCHLVRLGSVADSGEGGVMPQAIITYVGQAAKVVCDGNCAKAWGSNSRPKVYLSDNEDDYAYLADGELGEAPADPGTYEGGIGKPASALEFPTKWCVRECERCAMSMPGCSQLPLLPPSFAERFPNFNSRRAGN